MKESSRSYISFQSITLKIIKLLKYTGDVIVKGHFRETILKNIYRIFLSKSVFSCILHFPVTAVKKIIAIKRFNNALKFYFKISIDPITGGGRFS